MTCASYACASPFNNNLISKASKNMALTEAAFAEKMKKLNNSQQSIENTSSWCALWRDDARLVAEYWERAFTHGDQAKRLSLIYLANDVLQTRCAQRQTARAVP